MVIGVLSIFFAYSYTGGPLPLSYIGLGEVLALVFFGPVPVWGTNYLLTGSSSMNSAIAGLGPGLIAAALMSINNLRDIESDSNTTQTTIAVLIGHKWARVMTLSFIILSSFIPLILNDLLEVKWAILTMLTP